MADSDNNGSEIVLLKSEIEAAAARVAERALNETWTGASGFLGNVFGGLVGDRVKQWRTRNLVDTLVKTKDHLERKGVNIDAAKSLPMGELLSIFEGASRTDDVDLASMWAALLSNSMNPQQTDTTDPSFVRFLGELSGLDARILHYLKTYDDLSDQRNTKKSLVLKPNGLPMSDKEKAQSEVVAKIDQITKEYDAKMRSAREEITSNYSAEKIWYSVSNLLRMGLISNGSGGYDGDTLMYATLRRDRVELDTSGLRNELNWLWEKIDLTSEDNRPLPSMWFSPTSSEGPQYSNYALTGLAERFLKACS